MNLRNRIKVTRLKKGEQIEKKAEEDIRELKGKELERKWKGEEDREEGMKRTRVGQMHARDTERRGMRVRCMARMEIKGIREGTKGCRGVRKRR